MKDVILIKEYPKKITNRIDSTIAIERMPLTNQINEEPRKCIENENITDIEK